MKTWLLLAAVALCSATVPAAEPIRIRGSDTLGAKLVPLLCEGYRRAHPELRQGFDIAAEGSGTAFNGLLEGSADLGMSTRLIRSEESTAFATKGLKLDRITLAIDAFAIAVHESNPVSNLTSSQLEGVFTGDLTHWNQVGGKDLPITVLTRNTSSASYKDFSALDMSGRAYAKAGELLSSADHPAHTLANLPAGITYLPIAYAKASRIRILPINGKPFDPAQPFEYPLIRPCYFYIRNDVSPATKAFAEWCVTSPEAQKIVVTAGFFLPSGATPEQKKTGTR
ncbi:phosphate ABC transporter substrate-binding protein [Verrucomicrobium sp. BvORR106]|uniref:phosphate ABC transporter substrate-binding protein n=1 Tax=Verrucomicrobium sp. BvORR106 TaxID=1403819 RepID=UPI0009DD2B51|nr:phosphate ABC transporter substrate-binding protein [Verrucomicrobium sp. BvORR106]